MSLRIVVDMNLSSEWMPLLEEAGWMAVHWSAVGDPRADDATIMTWASAHKYAVFTHDLDFTTILALTGSTGPSVVQVRTQDVTPTHLEGNVVAALKKHAAILETGAVIVIDELRTRARILPLRK